MGNTEEEEIEALLERKLCPEILHDAEMLAWVTTNVAL